MGEVVGVVGPWVVLLLLVGLLIGVGIVDG